MTCSRPVIVHHTAPFLHPWWVKEVWAVYTGKTTTSLLPSPLHPHVRAIAPMGRARAYGAGVKEVMLALAALAPPFAPVGPRGTPSIAVAHRYQHDRSRTRANVGDRVACQAGIGTSCACRQDGTGTRRLSAHSLFALSGFSSAAISHIEQPQRTRRCIHDDHDLRRTAAQDR